MNEPTLVSDGHVAAAQDGAPSGPASGASVPSGYGARLAWERQRAGLGVTDVAASLRLHPNQVRALEQEDLARLPALAYVRGFIRSYARVVNVDPTPILSDLNAKLAPDNASVIDGMTSDHSVMRGTARERTSGWVIGIAVIGLLVLGAVGWFSTQREAEKQAPPAMSTPSAPEASAPAPVAATTPLPAAIEAAPPSVAVAEPVVPPADAAPVLPRSSANAAVAPTLLLRFNGTSWAEVTDASGKILLSQLGSAGAEHALDGELPLTIVIGDANNMSVEVRGEAFNLLPFMRNNVARFTVK